MLTSLQWRGRARLTNAQFLEHLFQVLEQSRQISAIEFWLVHDVHIGHDPRPRDDQIKRRRRLLHGDRLPVFALAQVEQRPLQDGQRDAYLFVKPVALLRLTSLDVVLRI